jgi:hypothetical protein
VLTSPQFSKRMTERPESGRLTRTVPYEEPNITEARMIELLESIPGVKE